MLSTTFLGHQGWLFQSKSACILVDPLLCEDFGHAQALEYRVFPPRNMTDVLSTPMGCGSNTVLWGGSAVAESVQAER